MDLDVGKTKMSLGSSIFDHFKLTTSWVINPFEVNHCAPNPIIDLSDQITGRPTLIQPKFIDSRRPRTDHLSANTTTFGRQFMRVTYVNFLIYCGIKVWWKPYGMPVTSVVARPSSVKVFASRTNRNIGLFFLVETTIESITPSSSSSRFSGLPTKTGSEGNISSSYQDFVS